MPSRLAHGQFQVVLNQTSVRQVLSLRSSTLQPPKSPRSGASNRKSRFKVPQNGGFRGFPNLRSERTISVELTLTKLGHREIWLYSFASERRRRHRSEQYFTSSQFFSHFLRQVKGSPQTGQTLVGKSDLERARPITERMLNQVELFQLERRLKRLIRIPQDSLK